MLRWMRHAPEVQLRSDGVIKVLCPACSDFDSMPCSVSSFISAWPCVLVIVYYWVGDSGIDQWQAAVPPTNSVCMGSNPGEHDQFTYSYTNPS